MPAVALRAVAASLATLALAGCAGGALDSAGSQAAPLATMAGRWMLAAPGAPPCGIEFRGGGNGGLLTPDGGCPANFYLSRRWAFDDAALAIKTESDEPLATFESKGGHFEGRTTDGTPVTLSRNPHR